MVGAHKKDTAIGFPPPLLGAEAYRLPILGETAAWLALDKPGGLAVRDHPWHAGVENLDTALNVQLERGKPELLRRCAECFGSVYYLDCVASGVTLFAKTRAAIADLRQRCGSGELSFTFRLTSADCTETTRLGSDAPLVPHRRKAKMIPSTAKGKKASTVFRRLARSAGWAILWEARTSFPRPHQIRAHAALCGIPVLGDALYGGPPMPSGPSGRMGRDGAGPGIPVGSSLPLLLWDVRCIAADDVIPPIRSEGGKRWEALIRRLKLHTAPWEESGG